MVADLLAIAREAVDEFGTPYSEYPLCPNPSCKDPHDVGRNYIGRTGDPACDVFVDEWFCHSCGRSFS